MKSENDDKSGKRVYEKPLLRVIDLAADEVLGTGCKTGPPPSPTGIGGLGCFSDACKFTYAS